MNVIEVQELVEVLEHDVDPQVVQRVLISQQLAGNLRRHDAHVVVGIGAEEGVVVEPFLLSCDAQDHLHSGQVRAGLTRNDVARAVYALPGLDPVVERGQPFGLFAKGRAIFPGPPEVHVAFLVELGAGGIEGMGELVSDGDAELRVELFVAHRAEVAQRAHIRTKDVDGVEIREVEAVVGVRRAGIGPLAVIQRLVDLLHHLLRVIPVDRHHGLPQGTALLGTGEVQFLAAVGLPAVRIQYVLLDGVQLFNGLRAGFLRQPVRLVQDAVIGLPDLFNHSGDAFLVFRLQVGLGIQLRHGPLQQSADHGGKPHFIGLHGAGGAVLHVVALLYPVVAFPIQP